MSGLLLHLPPSTGETFTGLKAQGTAMIYGQETRRGHIVETFRPGAFVNLEDPEITLIDGHDDSRLLARAGAGTLRLVDGPTELRWEAELPPTELGREVAALLRRKDYGGSSIGFVAEGELLTRDGPVIRRVINRARLLHVSPVGVPQYQTGLPEAAGRKQERTEIWTTNIVRR